MRRREFISLLGGAAVWPLTARAQQRSSLPIVGIAVGGSAAPLRGVLSAFEEGLKETGYVPGRNVVIEYRYAEGRFERFAGFMSDFIQHKVSVIVSSNIPGIFAAKKATSDIPIVFSIGEDPVELGLITSINRPEANLTGVYQFTQDLEAKRLALLHEMTPKAGIIGVLINPSFDPAPRQLRQVEEAASRLGLKLIVVNADTENEFDVAFATVVGQKGEALLVAASPFFNIRRQQLTMLAARHHLPAMYEWREFAEAGGLMSYGTKLAEAYRQSGVYTGRILSGQKPSDLPVVQLNKFELVINLSAAKGLGLEVPPLLSARADEVIE
jgi:putative tryptophan/tyrosine transport system substrate-binding protein